jgi:NAD(P)-dependent dehydrogenase (short-subunit alcohol dehydrogenase family)
MAATGRRTGARGNIMTKPVLLVTGGSRGIGAAIARLAGKQGFAVGVNYKNDAKAASAVAADIEKAGGKAIAIQGDMSVEADVERAFKEMDAKLGRMTHLVYNSGIVGKPSRVEAVETNTLREVIDVNLLGAFFCARAAIPRISKRHGGAGGSIVLISSIGSKLGGPNEYVWYAATKGAIDTMTVGLSKELADDGIRVNAVAPGLIDTEIHEPGRLDRITPMIPMKRPGTSGEVADSVLFLMSDAAAYISGAVLSVTGGR